MPAELNFILIQPLFALFKLIFGGGRSTDEKNAYEFGWIQNTAYTKSHIYRPSKDKNTGSGSDPKHYIWIFFLIWRTRKQGKKDKLSINCADEHEVIKVNDYVHPFLHSFFFAIFFRMKRSLLIKKILWWKKIDIFILYMGALSKFAPLGKPDPNPSFIKRIIRIRIRNLNL